MKRIFLVSVFLLMFSVSIFAQDEMQIENSKSEKAELVDEFGKLGNCDLTARLDSLFSELMNNPHLRGVIIVYQDASALPGDYGSLEQEYRDYIKFRNFDPSRVEIVGGVFRESQATELWKVPDGADSPLPSETVSRPTIPNDQSFAYDVSYIGEYDTGWLYEFVLDAVKIRREAEQSASEQEAAQETTEDAPITEAEPEITAEEPETEQLTPERIREIEEGRFSWTNENFGELIKEREDAHGVIVFYADEQEYDITKVQNHIEQGKQRIAKAAEIAPDKIQIVFGGYKTWIQAEFWIVPKNGKPPELQPEERVIEETETEADAEISQ